MVIRRLSILLLLCPAACLAQAQRLRKFELRAESAQFWKLIDHEARLTRMGTGFGFTEGPVWDPRGFLYVSDETLNKIFRLYPDGHREEMISLGDPDGNTFDQRLDADLKVGASVVWVGKQVNHPQRSLSCCAQRSVPAVSRGKQLPTPFAAFRVTGRRLIHFLR